MMMPNMSSWRPHRQVRMDRRRSRCKRLHRKTRNGWASSPVAFDVGSAVNGAEARGPCCERINALVMSLRAGHTSSHKRLFQLLGGPLLPSGLGLTGLWILFVVWRATPPPCALRLPSAARCLTMRRESAQVDQCAAGRTRTALASPNPPAERDKVDSVCAATEVRRAENLSKARPHVLVPSDSVSSGLSARSQKLALVAPHMRRRGKLPGDRSPKGYAGREPVALWICSRGSAGRKLHGR